MWGLACGSSGAAALSDSAFAPRVSLILGGLSAGVHEGVLRWAASASSADAARSVSLRGRYGWSVKLYVMMPTTFMG
jgi:hypothetical protein